MIYTNCLHGFVYEMKQYAEYDTISEMIVKVNNIVKRSSLLESREPSVVLIGGDAFTDGILLPRATPTSAFHYALYHIIKPFTGNMLIMKTFNRPSFHDECGNGIDLHSMDSCDIIE